MWRQRDRNKMGIRTFQRELEEKIQQKKQDESLVQKLLNTITGLSNKVDGLKDDIKQLQNKEVIVQVNSSDSIQNQKTEQKTNDRMFIPSVNTDNLKVSAGQVEKRERTIDISKTLQSLKELDKTEELK